MAKRSSKKKPAEPADLTTIIQQAVETVTQVVTKVVIDPEPVEGLPPAELVPEAPGKFGGAKDGKAPAGTLTPERRSEIARKAAQARWAKRRQSSSGDS